MKEVPLCNIALTSDVVANELESLISAIKLTSAKVQKEPSRVVGLDDVVAIITILVGTKELIEPVVKTIIKWRKEAKEKGIEAQVKLERPDRSDLSLIDVNNPDDEATDGEIKEWFPN
ncbi:MAG: hypothetical protein QNJ32_23375 [Xenococcaceae cyanobacterium MO_167.B27]|nr:hypothetical protein [Xenococcaceae cyanobacterium MO_167.B27]